LLDAKDEICSWGLKCGAQVWTYMYIIGSETFGNRIFFFTKFPNTAKRAENITCCMVFWTIFKVFGNAINNVCECLTIMLLPRMGTLDFQKPNQN